MRVNIIDMLRVGEDASFSVIYSFLAHPIFVSICHVALTKFGDKLTLLSQYKAVWYLLSITVNADRPPSHLCDGLMDCQNGR